MGIRTTMFAVSYDRQVARIEKAGLRPPKRSLPGDRPGARDRGRTGANLVHYGPAVESLTLTEPEPSMLRRLRRRAHELAPQATVLRAPAEDLPFDDDYFDVAVSTLVLCGVSDQPRSLRELRRVLRPGGELLFIEHVRSDDARVARHQDRMNGLNRFVAGCECNRSTLDSIRAAGFDIVSAEHGTLPKVPSFARPLVVGTATATPGGRRTPPVSSTTQHTR